MSKRHETDYTKFKKTNPDVTEEVTEPAGNESIENDEALEVVEEVTEPVIEQEPEIGVVTDCIRLNIRKSPSMDSDVEVVVDCLTRVKILDDSNPEFYKIMHNGATGYVMKKYIQPVQNRNQ